MERTSIYVPKVSVCVQTFNHVNYIGECLDSILSQKTDFDFEILLGEDDSNDGTRELCVEYQKKYPDIISLALHDRSNNIKVNGKPTGRYNFIYNLQRAKGQYIALCSGDDYWTNDNKLSMQLNAIESHENVSLVVSPWPINGKTFDYEKLVYRRVKKTIETQKTPGHTSSSFFVKPKILPDYLLEMTAGDRPLFNLVLDGGDALVSSYPLTYYRVHDSSVFSSLNKKQKLANHYHDLKVWYKHQKLTRDQYLKQAELYETSSFMKFIIGIELKVRKRYRSIIKRFS